MINKNLNKIHQKNPPPPQKKVLAISGSEEFEYPNPDSDLPTMQADME